MWNEVKNDLQFLPFDGGSEELAEDIIRSALDPQSSDLISLDWEDVMLLLRQPGTMRCFQKSVSWDSNRKEEAIEKLCAELEQVSDVCRAEYGDCLRFLIRIEACMEAGLEDVERCIRALTAKNALESRVMIKAQMQEGVQDGFFGVGGLIGAWDETLAALPK